MRLDLRVLACFLLGFSLYGCGKPAVEDELAELVQDSPELADQLIHDPLSFVLEFADQPDGSTGQAILLVLESLRDPSVLGPRPDVPPEDEGTVEYGDFFRAADHYRRNGPDEGARQQIGALMDQVFPANEIFELWTTLNPAHGSAVRSAPGARFQLMRSANAQGGPSDCGFAWSGVIPFGEEPEACFDVLAWTYRGSDLRIFYPISWTSSPPDYDYDYVERTQVAMNQSLDKFAGDLGLVNGNVDVRIFTADFGDNARADATPTIFEVPCIIRSFPLGYSKDGAASTEYRADIENHYKQTVAHEMYHCFQGWNYREPFFGPYLAAGSDSDAGTLFGEARKWWVEGTAEFAGNLVYPCNQREFERIPGFDRNSRSVSLMEMAYENVVFFMYMGSVNPSSVVEMSRNMATSGGFEEQYQAAAEYGLGRTFHEFGQRYVDRNVRDSCPGAVMPVRPVVDIYDVRRGVERDFEMARFMLVPLDLQFLSGDYVMEYTSPAVDERQSARESEATLWSVPPETVNAGCAVRNYRYVASYSQSDTPEAMLTIRETSAVDAGAGGGAPRTPVIDACLVGNWRATDASMQEIGDWLAANPLTRNTAVTEKQEISGTITGTFRRNGTVTGNLRDFTQKYLATMDMGNRTMSVGTTVIMDDSAGARYSAEGGVLTVWDACSTPTVRAVSELDGVVMSDQVIDLDAFSGLGSIGGFGRPPLSDDGTIPVGGEDPERMEGKAFALQIPSEFEMRYSCSGESLVIEHPDVSYSGMPPWRFTRTSER